MPALITHPYEVERFQFSHLIKLFKKFLEFRPNYINAYFFLAKLNAAVNEFDIAIDYLNKIADMKMKLNPANFNDPDLQKIPSAKIEALKEKFVKNTQVIGSADGAAVGVSL